MRKSCLFAAVLCTAVFASCSQDEHLDFVKDGKSNFTGALEVKDSRTSLDGNKVVWSTDDQVSIFEGDNANSLYEIDGITNGVASFKFVSYIDPTTWEDLDANYAVYPYDEDNTIAADGTISAVVPAAYTFKDRASSIENALMAAKSENTQLNFINAQGIIRLRLNAKKPTKYGNIQSIKLTSANNNLSGTATISFANTATPSAVILGDAGKELTINLDDAVKAELPSSTTATFAEFYVPVVPTDFAAGDLTLTVVGDKDTYVYKINAAISVGRKVIKPITHTLDGGGFSGEIDGETDEVWDGDSKTEVTPINGVYTITKASELAWMSARALTGNNGTAETVTIDLQKDIDMGGFEFSSIIAQRGDKLIFQGNGHTISNMKIVSGANDNTTGQAAMFYCYPSSTLEVSNLILKDITVTADAEDSGYAAAVVGYCEGNAVLDNVDVVNATVVGVKSSGLLVAHLSGSLDATNCDLGGTVTLNAFSGEPEGHYAGKYIGTIAGAASLTNCTVNATVGGSLTADNVGDVYGRMTNAGSLTINGMVYVASTEQLTAAINAGNQEILLAAGNYTLPNAQNKNITLIGVGEETVVDYSHMGGYQEVSGSSLSFKDMTLKVGDNYTKGLQHTVKVTYENCQLIGWQGLYADEVEFTKCKLDSDGGEHCVWTYGADKVTFTECDFTYSDRAVNCFGYETDDDVITFTDCTFNFVEDQKTVTGAIEVNSNDLNSLTLTINGCSVNKGDLWWISEWDTKNYGAKTYTTVDGKVQVCTTQQLAAMIDKDVTEIYLLDGNYYVPSCQNKTITLGGGEGAIIDASHNSYGYQTLSNANITFEGVTIKGADQNFTCKGFAHALVNFNKCTIINELILNGDSEFTECTFNTSGDIYSIWTWGANNAKFKKCIFNTDGKAILYYGEGTRTVNVTIEECTFNDSGVLTSKKAAVEIGDAPYGATPTYNLTISGTTVYGYEINDEGIGTGTTLWGNKNSMPDDRLNVVVDGVIVY